MAKRVTIDGHEVKLTRRRYGTTTYTWARVQYNGENLELGDPWPCITPKRAELEQAARREIALARSHYGELVAKCDQLVEAYRDDLLVHDREVLIQAAGTPYLHWSRETGTDLEVLWPHDSEAFPAPGVTVPYLFGTADRDKILRDKQVAADHNHSPMSIPCRLCLYFNGRTLREITTERVVEIVRDYIKSVRYQWDQEGRRS